MGLQILHVAGELSSCLPLQLHSCMYNTTILSSGNSKDSDQGVATDRGRLLFMGGYYLGCGFSSNNNNGIFPISLLHHTACNFWAVCLACEFSVLSKSIRRLLVHVCFFCTKSHRCSVAIRKSLFVLVILVSLPVSAVPSWTKWRVV